MSDKLYQDFIIPHLEEDGQLKHYKAQITRQLFYQNPDGWGKVALRLWHNDMERIKTLDSEQ